MILDRALTRTKEILNTLKAPDRWTDSQLVRCISYAQEQIRSAIIPEDPDAWSSYATLTQLGVTLTDGERGMVIAELPWYVEHVRRMEVLDHARMGWDASLEQVSIRQHRPSTWEFFETFAGVARWVFLGPRKIAFTSSPGDVGVWFIRRLPPLARFTLTAGTATSATFSRTVVPDLGEIEDRAGAYDGSSIFVHTAGNAAPQREIARVTSSAAGAFPGYTLTLESTLPATLDPGDKIEVMPWIELRDLELCCYWAAFRALDSVGATTQKGALAETLDALQRTHMNRSNSRKESTPDQVQWAGDAW